MMSSATAGAGGATKFGHHSSASSTSSSAATPSACAACKYQRRRCTRDCILAPYFPADNQKQFLNAHRLFGVANIMKILNNVEPDRRELAMRSIIDQSNLRAHDPVGGCYRLIVDLEKKIAATSAELKFVRSKIDFYRSQVESAATIAGSGEPNCLQAIAGTEFYPNMGAMAPQQQYYNYYLMDSQEGQSSDMNGNVITNEVGLGMNINPQPVNNGLELEILSLGQAVDGEDEARPLADIFNMRPPFGVEGDSRDISADSIITSLHYSPKIDQNEDVNHMENVLEHDLKGAASLFTLTNSNT